MGVWIRAKPSEPTPACTRRHDSLAELNLSATRNRTYGRDILTSCPVVPRCLLQLQNICMRATDVVSKLKETPYLSPCPSFGGAELRRVESAP